ncbi:unnamed protein product [Sphagnum balticum]
MPMQERKPKKSYHFERHREIAFLLLLDILSFLPEDEPLDGDGKEVTEEEDGHSASTGDSPHSELIYAEIKGECKYFYQAYCKYLNYAEFTDELGEGDQDGKRALDVDDEIVGVDLGA